MGDGPNEAVAEAPNEGDNKNKGDGRKEAVADDKSPAESATDEMNNGTKFSNQDPTFDDNDPNPFQTQQDSEETPVESDNGPTAVANPDDHAVTNQVSTTKRVNRGRKEQEI